MGNEDRITNEYFEAKGVSRGEFEALKRFGDYEQLSDGTLMPMEGDKEFRIYCEESGWPFFGVILTRGQGKVLAAAHERVMEKLKKDPGYLDHLKKEHKEAERKIVEKLKADGNWPPEHGFPHLINAEEERYAKRQ